MTRTILILALVPFLGGCDFLRIMEGKPSDAQVEHERREALGLEPAENVWDTPLQFADIPGPSCVPEFRVWDCVGNTRVPFEW